ncbi:MAG: transposase [Acidobacteriota bacterium]
MSKKRRRFSREFKLDVIRMVTESGHRVVDVSKELDLRPDMVRRWVKQFTQDPELSFPGVGHQRARDAEVAKLRRELSRVREERDILKKAVAIFSDRRP